ncbi:hypothetical protein J6K67_10575 [Leuconostoc mesenteroides]|nr:hypothetical protein [Leuconostoc mesenteroides]
MVVKSGNDGLDGRLDVEKVDNGRAKIGMGVKNQEKEVDGASVEDDVAFGLENIKVAR